MLQEDDAFLGSAKRSVGVLEWVRIKSVSGEPCRVKLEVPDGMMLAGDCDVQRCDVGPDVFEVNIGNGEVAELRVVPC